MSTITLDYSNMCQSVFDNFKSFKGYAVGYGGEWSGGGSFGASCTVAVVASLLLAPDSI